MAMSLPPRRVMLPLARAAAAAAVSAFSFWPAFVVGGAARCRVRLTSLWLGRKIGVTSLSSSAGSARVSVTSPAMDPVRDIGRCAREGPAANPGGAGGVA
ncbi:hypothetical protein C8F04DRAFT_1153631 [Mycena alexandri]|uniref:Uncharacterized protein n=1 Tax=Mycena alexandri TaxID=1745969 RepID=A0AAD6WL34_9AGAR|nr:hypothetical protein C8F04DRAFT_1154296 [Mycena alexandri]KAJ7017978.1 hypothetical protein C8F04DRAFT_1153631 [Mycena alexandri]